jgi:hypothetical protein
MKHTIRLFAAHRPENLSLENRPSPVGYSQHRGYLEKHDHARNGPPLCFWLFLLGTIENLQECRHSGAHSAMQIGLTALDVVMEIVTEKLDVRNGSIHLLGVLEVARKED